MGHSSSRSSLAMIEAEYGREPECVLGMVRKWGKGHSKTEISIPVKLEIRHRAIRLNAFSSKEAAEAWKPARQQWRVFRPRDLQAVYGIYYVMGKG